MDDFTKCKFCNRQYAPTSVMENICKWCAVEVKKDPLKVILNRIKKDREEFIRDFLAKLCNYSKSNPPIIPFEEKKQKLLNVTGGYPVDGYMKQSETFVGMPNQWKEHTHSPSKQSSQDGTYKDDKSKAWPRLRDKKE